GYWEWIRQRWRAPVWVGPDTPECNGLRPALYVNGCPWGRCGQLRAHGAGRRQDSRKNQGLGVLLLDASIMAETVPVEDSGSITCGQPTVIGGSRHGRVGVTE